MWEIEKSFLKVFNLSRNQKNKEMLPKLRMLGIQAEGTACVETLQSERAVSTHGAQQR